MKKGWMVRAGGGGRLFEEFEKGYVAIGWKAIGDLSRYITRQQLVDAFVAAFPNAKEATATVRLPCSKNSGMK